MQNTKVRAAELAILALCLASCEGGQPDDNGSAGSQEDLDTLVDPNRVLVENIPEGTLALGSSFDWSGQIETQIMHCQNSTPLQHPAIQCSVDPDFVVVGGGAWAEYSGQGALLTASFPVDSNLQRWEARSKDHLFTNPHVLHVYAIGMRIQGVSRSTLFSSMRVVQATSSQASSPEIKATLPPGFFIIGGGARVNWTGQGNLLVRSIPADIEFVAVPGPPAVLTMQPRSWSVKSKDHVSGSGATITAFAIGIPISLPGVGYVGVARYSIAGGQVATGVASANINLNSGQALAAIGGESTWSGSGRLLFRMAPPDFVTNTSILVQSKDHAQQSSGSVTAHALAIQKWR